MHYNMFKFGIDLKEVFIETQKRIIRIARNLKRTLPDECGDYSFK